MGKISVEDMGLKGYDSFFGKKSESGEKIQMVPLTDLSDFEGHPFLIREEKVEEMAESIREYGVLMPGIVRRKPYGGYEIIAGHTRKRACEKAGLTEMPVIIKDLDDDESTVLMVDSNIQREKILPSEKAKAYSMKYHALKNQGHSGNSLKAIGEESGENYKAIQRYVWIARLIDDFLQMLDEGSIGMGQAVALSNLSQEQQELVLSVTNQLGCHISLENAEELKKIAKEEELTEQRITGVFYSDVLKKSAGKEDIVLKAKDFNAYFPPDYTREKKKELIQHLLKQWWNENKDDYESVQASEEHTE